MKKLLLTTIVISTLIFARTQTRHDLVEVRAVNPDIVFEILYATPNNFTGKTVYDSPRCFLRKKTAQKINAVQKELEKMGLGLKIWDGYRPRSVQYIFWDLTPDRRYVADPSKGSKHNSGAAVDCTLIDLETGQELEMPSEFDDLSERAHRDYNKMSSEAAKNCKLLELIMAKHGFVGLPTEWWHFDDTDWKQYDLLDIPISQIN